MQCVFCNRSFKQVVHLVDHEDEHRKPKSKSKLVGLLSTLPREIRVKIRNLLIGDLGTLWKLNEKVLAARFFGEASAYISVPHGAGYKHMYGRWYTHGDTKDCSFQDIVSYLNTDFRKKVRVVTDTRGHVGEEYQYTSGEALLFDIADTLSRLTSGRSG